MAIMARKETCPQGWEGGNMLGGAGWSG